MTMFALCAGCHEQAYQGTDRTTPVDVPRLPVKHCHPRPTRRGHRMTGVVLMLMGAMLLGILIITKERPK